LPLFYSRPIGLLFTPSARQANCHLKSQPIRGDGFEVYGIGEEGKRLLKGLRNHLGSFERVDVHANHFPSSEPELQAGECSTGRAMRRISPIAWQHINLQGRFEFLKPPDGLNVDTIIRALTTPHAGRVVNLFP
jgi:hypothetical protein